MTWLDDLGKYYTAAPDQKCAEWLNPARHTLRAIMPTGYDAYVRVQNPNSIEGEWREIAKPIFDILLQHNEPDQDCVCGFWRGFGQTSKIDAAAVPSCSIDCQLYYLFNSSLSQVCAHWLDVEARKDVLDITPSLFWPTSKDWYFAIPFDHGSSYFGGSIELANALRNCPGIEAHEAFLTDNLWGDG